MVTGHRRESFGGGFERICEALRQIATKYPAAQVLYPVHLNPNVQEPVNRLLKGLDNVFLIEPQQYLPFCYLMDRASIILTDSGGIQEEAPSLGKPVLVMRETTERPEAVDAGTVRLVGTDIDLIVAQVDLLLTNSCEYQKMSKAHNPYGDGLACGRILEFLVKEKKCLLILFLYWAWLHWFANSGNVCIQKKKVIGVDVSQHVVDIINREKSY